MLETMTDAEKGYLAGMLDGDGCITVLKSSYYKTRALSERTYYYPCVVITNTDLKIIKFIERLTDFSSTIGGYGYRLTIPRKKLFNFLVMILPYLVGKKKQAELALLLLRDKTKENIYEKIKTLNGRRLKMR